ncbi:TPR repeat [Polaribacter sp. KT25b]|uniref:serine/threonine-protein kinase n=1 Tax=Polaribacter sp. KT25b TaxID=1855336 RepID=UPI00087AE742|nr:serine/threonine-protein kinase [Polaribacter sp. KT25b]SDR99011.1 TPR repeat [Polaribacter sp. KT25b]
MTQQEFRNRYEFDLKTDTIGGGSFGTVYKAYDTVLDIEVAIKVSEVKIVGDKEFSLLEEFKAIENLKKHQNIANYEEVFRFESFPTVFDYGIMQYYSLGNLSHYLKNNEVSIAKREKITKGVLEGIAFLHQHNVVHRDLKPSNVLVVDRKGEIIPKITDFGLSKQAEGDGKASRFTNSFAGGTLQYSSPEQLKGMPLKLNTDLWSFGAIAYEILTGKTLFEADSQGTASAEWQNTITQKILHADINEELQNLPSKWQKVVRLCLERDVNKRVQNTVILFKILNADESVINSNELQNKNVQKSVESNNEATIIKGNKELKKDVEKTKETSQSPALSKNDATIIKGNKKEEKVVEKPKPYTNQKVTKLKKEESKWMLPAVASVVILIASTIGYFMFSSKDIKVQDAKLSIFKEGNFYGYKQENKIIIPAKYKSAALFVNDSAIVSIKDSSFYINKKENWLGTYLKDTISLTKGEDYYYGFNGVKQHYTEALKWFLKAAKNKSVDAQNYLGYMYHFGKGVPINYEEAQKWYFKAVEQGSASAQSNLGSMYQYGRGFNISYKKALIWYRKSAEQGFAIAQNNLAFMYQYGYGVSIDYKEAMMWYQRAANQDELFAQINIGRMYASGSGVEKNKKEAEKWYLKAAKLGNEKASWYFNRYGYKSNKKKWDVYFDKLKRLRIKNRIKNMFESGEGISRKDINEIYLYY